MGSRDGHCRPFDADATGTVFGHGVGVVLLKRLEDALADGDRIDAVIRGFALTNDGAAKVSYMAPGVDGQSCGYRGCAGDGGSQRGCNHVCGGARHGNAAWRSCRGCRAHTRLPPDDATQRILRSGQHQSEHRTSGCSGRSQRLDQDRARHAAQNDSTGSQLPPAESSHRFRKHAIFM